MRGKDCWNGSLPPIGYRVVAAQRRSAGVEEEKLEIDPLHADTVRLIYRLALEGDGTCGPMGVKKIVPTSTLGASSPATAGAGASAGTRMLTRTTYVGQHEFNKRAKTKG